MNNPEFNVHKLNDAGMEKAIDIALVFDRALTSLINLCPSGRHLAIVKTKLEEACFFAKKAMAESPENQAE